VKRTSIGLAAVMIGVLACGVASADVWDETANGGGDAGALITTGQVLPDGTAALTLINGSIGTNPDADLYKIHIANEGVFTASTKAQYGGSAAFDSRLYLFDANGMGVSFNDDDPVYGGTGSTISSTFVTANGWYWLGISKYPLSPNGTNGGFIWNSNPYNTERAPDGPGAAYPLASWSGAFPGGSPLSYSIALTGVVVPEPATLGLLGLALVVWRRR
jgi:hypothetical protein